jgi:sorbitol-specific phosphotransferase system component IIA
MDDNVPQIFRTSATPDMTRYAVKHTKPMPEQSLTTKGVFDFDESTA